MKIVLVGAGMIGRTVISQLSKEKHDVVVIESNIETADKVNENYDVMVINGNGTNLDVMKDAKVDEADLFIALTAKDETNILCCTLAKRLGAKSTIARVRNPEYGDVLAFLKDDLSLSIAINPECDFTMDVARVLQFPSALSIETFNGGNVELMEFKIPKGSKLDGVSLMDLNKKYSLNVLICTVCRGEDIFIPKGDFILKEEDTIYLTSEVKSAQRFVKHFGLFTQRIKKVMILGGKIDGYYLAKELFDNGLTVKIVEEDKNRAEELSTLLPFVSVINGSLTDTDMLTEEKIADVDAVVCLTGNDDTNIMISLFAKKLGVKKVITRIDKTVIKEVMAEMGLDLIISPRDVVANTILKHVRSKSNAEGADVITLHKLLGGNVEATEFLVDEKSRLNGKKLKELKLKKNVIIGAVVKGKEYVIPCGDTLIEEGNTVIIVTTEQLKSLEEIF